MATTTQVLMSEDPTQYTTTGYTKQKSIWGDPVAPQQDRWSARPMFAGALAPGPLVGAQGTVNRAVSSTAVGSGAVPSSSSSSSSGSGSGIGSGAGSGSAHGGSGIAAPVNSSYLYYKPTSTATNPQPAVSATSASVDEDLIPTAIVVKNIPFAIKKEQLVEVMTHLGLPLPYAFNYHFDKGVFRGLAFANYATAEETAVVISALNGREIGGRKLRVEYKKMLPLQERERIEREKRERRGQLEEQHTSQSSSLASSPLSPSQGLEGSYGVGAPLASHMNALPSPSAPGSASGSVNNANVTIDLNDNETLDLYTSLVLFSAQPTSEVTLARTSVVQRKVIQKLCFNLGLGIEDRDGNLVIHSSGYAAYPSALFPH